MKTPQTASEPLPASDLLGCVVGSRIWFDEERQPYKVRSRNARFVVCTKPYNPRRTVIYTVVDLDENVRGPENLVFGMGAETDDDCNEMIARLGTETEVSHRNRIPLRVTRVSQPNIEYPYQKCG